MAVIIDLASYRDSSIPLLQGLSLAEVYMIYRL